MSKTLYGYTDSGYWSEPMITQHWGTYEGYVVPLPSNKYWSIMDKTVYIRPRSDKDYDVYPFARIYE